MLVLHSEFLGAYALEVRNILMLTGDKPSLGDHPTASGVFDVDSAGLARMASQLNKGLDYFDRPLADATDFFIGAVANPVLADLSSEMARIEAKIHNGVQFFQTQPIYTTKQLEDFQRQAPKGVPFIFGIMPLKSAKQGRYLNNNVPGVHVPEEMINLLESKGRQAGLDWCRKLINDIRQDIDGIHIFPMGDYALAESLLTF